MLLLQYENAVCYLANFYRGFACQQVECGALSVDSDVSCMVDYERRSKVAPNHTMTHMLNFALRKVGVVPGWGSGGVVSFACHVLQGTCLLPFVTCVCGWHLEVTPLMGAT